MTLYLAKEVAPQLTFEQGMDIDLGRVAVKVLYPGSASHTTGCGIVVVPAEKVLFTGDILFTDFHPFLGEGDFQGRNKALDMIAAMDMPRVVPGHGPLSGGKDGSFNVKMNTNTRYAPKEGAKTK